MSLSRAGEPKPIWPQAPRLAPDRAFPAYRFVPGQSPHPTKDHDGHPYRIEIVPRPLHPWRRCEDYLYGIDLYHNGYFWEAHEAWEGLWRKTDAGSLDQMILQGLIFNTAAQLKLHMKQLRGARIHCRRSYDKIREAAVKVKPGSEAALGLDFDSLTKQLSGHYLELWMGGNVVVGPAPRIEVTR